MSRARKARMEDFRRARDEIQARNAAARKLAVTQRTVSEPETQMDAKPEVHRE